MQQDYIPVSTLGEYIKRIIDSEDLLYKIKIFGEVSSYNVSNGNAYFVLKDEKAIMNCTLFDCFKFKIPAIGTKLIVTGTPRYYVKGGKLSFNAENIEEFGKGDLFLEFLKLKNKLESEGLFDLSHKKEFPSQINKIGVVTAENGAVIHDIINVASRRNPNIEIKLYSTKVQGIGAEYEIVKGIEYFNNSDVDAIIVARGGGSNEDLSPYNTEVVARSVYNSTKFIVSAVGHETDYTIIDFVADLRAPTPSAAAEILVKEVVNLKEKIESYEKQLYTKILNILKINKNKIDVLTDKLFSKFQNTIKINESKVNLLISSLKDKNPLNLLEKGYVKVEKNNKVINTINMIKLKDELNIIFKDGNVKVEVKDINGRI